MKSSQSPHTALQRKTRSKGGVTPSPSNHRQRRASTTRQQKTRFREFVWAALLAIFLTVFARRRNFAELGATYEHNYNAYGGDAAPPRSSMSSLWNGEQPPPIISQTRRSPPRILRYDFQKNEATSLANARYFHKHRHLPLDYKKLPEEKGGKKKNSIKVVPLCVEMEEWQTARFLSCNQVHETNMKSIRFINCGASRCAFQFNDIDGTAQVLKTQFFDTVDERDMEFARKDALALERLTKSPYVANIYGSCGMTQTLEYSDYGNLFDWMKLTRAKERPALTPMERLKFGIQMTTAVADVHSIDYDEHNWVSMTHNDICCHQFIHVDGIFKLGDFHLSTFHKKSRIHGMACNTTNLSMNAAMKKVRAPEEMYGRVSASREKVDVYLVGNMMYLILTHQWLFEGMPTAVAMSKLKSGQRPEIGFEPTDPADIALVKAINWAWTQDPAERPKMREVSNFLKGELRKLEGIDEDYVVRVSIPPLPKDYDFSDLQFYQNLGTDLHGHPV